MLKISFGLSLLTVHIRILENTVGEGLEWGGVGFCWRIGVSWALPQTHVHLGRGGALP